MNQEEKKIVAPEEANIKQELSDEQVEQAVGGAGNGSGKRGVFLGSLAHEEFDPKKMGNYLEEAVDSIANVIEDALGL